MIKVNGELVEVPEPAVVAAVVTQVVGADRRRGVAVAVNGEVVPRAEWDSTVLASGDQVEVLTASQGG